LAAVEVTDELPIYNEKKVGQVILTVTETLDARGQRRAKLGRRTRTSKVLQPR
jgi:hypothetical protein